MREVFIHILTMGLLHMIMTASLDHWWFNDLSINPCCCRTVCISSCNLCRQCEQTMLLVLVTNSHKSMWEKTTKRRSWDPSMPSGGIKPKFSDSWTLIIVGERRKHKISYKTVTTNFSYPVLPVLLRFFSVLSFLAIPDILTVLLPFYDYSQTTIE